MASFHPRCGKRVTLLNNNTTAVRSDLEFNHGIVLSAEPLQADYLFEVKLDKKVSSWSGNIEIGVTSCHPETIELPSCGVSLRHGSWVMSANSILKDGLALKEFYGCNLDKLNVGERVGVMRTSSNEMVIYINGISQGIAATNLPAVVYAVIDMYGKCVQVSISPNRGPLEHNNDEFLSCGESSGVALDNEVTGMSMSLASTLSELSLDLRQTWSLNLPVENTNYPNTLVTTVGDNMTSPRDRLRFHTRCGNLVKLTLNYRSAERRRPLDEFNNGVVMTNRPLQDDELFEIRIDRLVEKWSGSIEVGVTTHNPSTLEFPATMTNMRSGTIMMSGCGILTNGKGTRREYGEFNLDELREGDRVGMMRKSNGNLHYFINGLDQGIAACKVAHHVWGVIDLYGMTIKVTIVDKDERESQNLITRRNTLLRDQHLNIVETHSVEIDCYDRLMFHPNCGAHADVVNNGRTAHRPNAIDDFNNGVVLTTRPLKINEQFEVRLDKVVAKWAGSIEIGVTTHSPTELEFPFTMTNVRSGTWMMTGNGVMHNGTTVIDQYGQNLDRLQVGDRVAVLRKENGTLHFFVNGIDQGPAAASVPERVYGVIDLYGQAAQATIQDALDYSPDTMNSCVSNTTMYSDLRFHHIGGKNARISNNGLTASRPRALAEFNDAIVFSNRPLREEELFEISLEKMVDRWSGSIELGVSAMRPEELELPSTATDLEHDTWMLSGAVVMENGVNLKNGYKLDLDSLTADCKIGVMRLADGMLHYYLNGVDQGPACVVSASSVYAVVDLYGQCAQVTIVGNNNSRSVLPLASPIQSEEPTPASLQASIVHNPLAGNGGHNLQPLDSYLAHKFSEFHGKNIELTENNTIASRLKDNSQYYVFSSHMLNTDDMFEIEIMSLAPQYAGGIIFGATCLNINDAKVQSAFLASPSPPDWYITGNNMYANSQLLNTKFCPSLEWLRVGDRIGLKRSHDGCLRIFINMEEMATIANNIPEAIYAMVGLFGVNTSIHVISFKSPPPPPATTMSMSMSPLTSLKLHDSLELVLDPPSHQFANGKPLDFTDATDVESISEIDRFEFYEIHGRNIEILPNRTTARRVASYNQGVVMISRPLIKGQILEVIVEKVNPKWTSSLMLGIVCMPPSKVNFSVTNLHGFKKHSWIISNDWLSINGQKIKSNYGVVLDKLKAGSVVGLLLSEVGRLSLYVNDVNFGPLPAGLPTSHNYYAVFDLYGQCEQITILNNQCDNSEIEQKIPTTQPIEEPSTSSKTDSNQQLEKADLESHEKESHSPDSNLNSEITEQSTQNNIAIQEENKAIIQPEIIQPIIFESNRKCEYVKECLKFKNSLVLPDEFFSNENPICYCSECYQAGNETYLRKGEPPEEYSIPFGWVKFILKCPASASAITEKWHVAYYGTPVNVIRSILDRKQPLTKEQQHQSILIRFPVGKGESSSSQIEFSPCLEYATSDTKYSYTDKQTSNKIQVTAAFQLLVRPGAYSTNQELEVTADECNAATSTQNLHIPNSEANRSIRKWYTKESGAIILHSLLLKLESS